MRVLPQRLIMSSLLSLLLSACSNPPYPRGSVEKLYPLSERPTLSVQDVAGHQLQIASMGGSGQTPLLFIHGSPGDWKAWAHYLESPELAGFSPRIAIDRPGFGGSEPGQVMPDLRAQAALIAELIPPGPPAVIVGHSLGGPLLAWLAPDEMLWSNREILVLQQELQRLKPEWSRLRRPLVIVQGERDELVDPRTADYAEQVIPSAYRRIVRIADQGHFILWKQPETVIAAIKSLPCETPR